MINLNTIVLFTFFKSTNLGDKLLSQFVLKKFGKNSKVIFVDFPTLEIIQDKYSVKYHRHNPIKIQTYKTTKVYRYLSLLKFIFNRSNKSKIKDLKEQLPNSCTFIFSSGNMLMDLNPVWIYLIRSCLKIIKPKEVYFTYVGVGPIDLKINKYFLNDILNQTNKISVRDTSSQDVINSFNKDAILTIDPILTYDLKYPAINVNSRNLVGICFLGEVCFKDKKSYLYYLNTIKNIINKLETKNLNYVIFSTDLDDYAFIYKYFNKNIRSINSEEDLKNLYNSLYFLVGGRMHSIIYAQTQLVPFVGFNWQQKVNSLFKDINNINNLFECNKTYDEEIIEIIEDSLKNPKIINNMNKINKENIKKFNLAEMKMGQFYVQETNK